MFNKGIILHFFSFVYPHPLKTSHVAYGTDMHTKTFIRMLRLRSKWIVYILIFNYLIQTYFDHKQV